MNETIALPRLAELLSQTTGISINDAEKFITLFFTQIENALSVSDEVSVSGLGTFFRSVSSDEVVKFTPDPLFSEAINRPFEMFEPIAIGDTDFDESNDTPQVLQQPATAPVVDDNTKDETSLNEEVQPVSEIVPIEQSSPDITPPEYSAPTTANQATNDYNTNHLDTAPTPKHSKFAICVAFLLGIILGTFATILYFVMFTDKSDANYTDAEIIDLECGQPVDVEYIEYSEADSISEYGESDNLNNETLKAEKPVVYDTVTPNRFLTTMARQYYNQMEYWVFIYQANADKLANPNRIKPGTQVIIPSREDFETDKSQEATIERAKALARDIYSSYE